VLLLLLLLGMGMLLLRGCDVHWCCFLWGGLLEGYGCRSWWGGQHRLAAMQHTVITTCTLPLLLLVLVVCVCICAALCSSCMPFRSTLP
jgi:hypothetical protein